VRRLWLFAAPAVAAALIAAATPHRPAKVYQIVINSLAYGPAPPTLHVGDKVQWVNKDMFLHSATAADHSFDVTLKPNTVGGVTLTHPGVISYICRYHPGMKGQLVVSK
jgi:plastocyanin